MVATAHSHPHAGHSGNRLAGRFAVSAAITVSFVVVEIVAGLRAHSLALLTDAAHNVTDVIALALSWYALWLASRPAHSSKTFGSHRAGILVALLNSTTLVVISLGIFYEAYHRLLDPPDVRPGILTAVGAIALVVNAVTAWLVRHGAEHDLNVRSAYLHLMGDVLSSLGAVAAGILIMLTGKTWLDPAVSILIGFLILSNAWSVLRETVGILLEDAPDDIDMNRVAHDLREAPGVLGVHDLHVWSITRSLRALSAHILVEDVSVSAGAAIQREIATMLERRYRIGHATLQLECVDCGPEATYCRLGAPDRDHGEGEA